MDRSRWAAGDPMRSRSWPRGPASSSMNWLPSGSRWKTRTWSSPTAASSTRLPAWDGRDDVSALSVHASRRSRESYRLIDVARSEWTKFVSLRSARWILVAFAVSAVVLGGVISVVAASHYSTASPQTRADWDPTN